MSPKIQCGCGVYANLQWFPPLAPKLSPTRVIREMNNGTVMAVYLK